MNTHTSGPVNFAIEGYTIDGAKPDTAYAVVLLLFAGSLGPARLSLRERCRAHDGRSWGRPRTGQDRLTMSRRSGYTTPTGDHLDARRRRVAAYTTDCAQVQRLRDRGALGGVSGLGPGWSSLPSLSVRQCHSNGLCERVKCANDARSSRRVPFVAGIIREWMTITNCDGAWPSSSVAVSRLCPVLTAYLDLSTTLIAWAIGAIARMLPAWRHAGKPLSTPVAPIGLFCRSVI